MIFHSDIDAEIISFKESEVLIVRNEDGCLSKGHEKNQKELDLFCSFIGGEQSLDPLYLFCFGAIEFEVSKRKEHSVSIDERLGAYLCEFFEKIDLEALIELVRNLNMFSDNEKRLSINLLKQNYQIMAQKVAAERKLHRV
jgi:hypothetical protein